MTTTSPVRIATRPPVPPASRPLRAVPPPRVTGTQLRDILEAAGARVQAQIEAERAAGIPAPEPVRRPSLVPATDADDCARGPIVAPAIRAAADYAPDPVELDGDADPVALDGRRCDTCRGYGLVRAAGKRAGQHYRSNDGAQAAMANGNAVDCPTCDGMGLVLDTMPAELVTA